MEPNLNQDVENHPHLLINMPPAAKDLTQVTEQELIKQCLFHVINCSTKLTRCCELSGELVKEDNDDFIISPIRGHKTVTIYPRGYVNHLDKYQYRMDMLNLCFEVCYNVLSIHNFLDLDEKVIIPRSDGSTSEASISKDYGLRYSTSYDKIVLNVEFYSKKGDRESDDLFVKNVRLDDIYRLNPTFPELEITIYESLKYPQWLIDERKEWENFMTSKLNLTLSNVGRSYTIKRIN